MVCFITCKYSAPKLIQMVAVCAKPLIWWQIDEGAIYILLLFLSLYLLPSTSFIAVSGLPQYCPFFFRSSSVLRHRHDIETFLDNLNWKPYISPFYPFPPSPPPLSAFGMMMGVMGVTGLTGLTGVTGGMRVRLETGWMLEGWDEQFCQAVLPGEAAIRPAWNAKGSTKWSGSNVGYIKFNLVTIVRSLILLLRNSCIGPTL